MTLIHIKNDLKQLVREPMMLMLFISPILIICLFKAIISLIVPFVQQYIAFSIEDYKAYILAFIFILTSGMLGIVTGFMMLDERDGKIAELMAVTPLGRSGYLFNRLSFTFIATFGYTFVGYFIVDIYQVPIVMVLFLGILLGLFSSTMGLIIFTISSDKVKGLTYAKGLNVIMLFCLTDLLHEKWLTQISKFFPTYWITEMIQHPKSLSVLAIAALIHVSWFLMILWRDHGKSSF